MKLPELKGQIGAIAGAAIGAIAGLAAGGSIDGADAATGISVVAGVAVGAVMIQNVVGSFVTGIAPPSFRVQSHIVARGNNEPDGNDLRVGGPDRND